MSLDEIDIAKRLGFMPENSKITERDHSIILTGYYQGLPALFKIAHDDPKSCFYFQNDLRYSHMLKELWEALYSSHLECGVHEGRSWWIQPKYKLTLEYALQQRMFNMSQLLEWQANIAEALEFIHEQHLVHGDYKPSQAYINDNNLALLNDFGITAPENCTDTAISRYVLGAGTFPYQSYEETSLPMIEKKLEVSRRTDPYSFVLGMIQVSLRLDAKTFSSLFYVPPDRDEVRVEQVMLRTRPDTDYGDMEYLMGLVAKAHPEFRKREEYFEIANHILLSRDNISVMKDASRMLRELNQ